ncbi:hypothetical protein GCM10009735_43880 [Actinomadura chokoriensis]
MVDTGPGAPRRPDDIRHTPASGLPRATPREGTPVQPPGAPIPPGAPTRPIVQASPTETPRVWGTPPEPATPPRGTSPQPGVPPQLGGVPQPGAAPQPGGISQSGDVSRPVDASRPGVASQTGGVPQLGAAPQTGGVPQAGDVSWPEGVSRTGGLPQPGGLPQTIHLSQAGTGSGTGPQPSDLSQTGGWPRVGGPSEPVGPARAGAAEWAGVPEAQDAYSERQERSSTTGPMGVRETSGVQVRLGSRERERDRQARRRAGRRSGLVAAGVLVLAGLVTAGLVLTPGSGDDGGGTEAAPSSGEQSPIGTGELPDAGTPITVGTADGSKYRLAAVTSGVSDGVAPTSQSSPPSGTSFPYVEYILSNPTQKNVLLDFPGDVFVRRSLVAPDAQGRCMPQAGVPEDMCTPPTRSQVVRHLAGGQLVPGDGGDKYLPPNSSFLVRATVDVPVNRAVKRTDMGLYVWKQLYMADQLAKQAPFPR